jgi:protein ImuB
MRLWIGLHLSQLPLEVFCPNWLPDSGVVVLEQDRVLALSGIAYAGGLRVGMRRASVPMLLPAATLYQREPAREAQALRDTALALLQYTPLAADAEQATLLLDIGASLRLFGGIRALCKKVLGSMRLLGFSASLSCAPTARGAWLLAQAGADACTPRRSLSMTRLVTRLDRLPVALLPSARPFLAWLDGIGCHTLGDLRHLPRPGLQRRCGKPLLDALDCAYGQAPELFEWIVAPPSFRARFEFFERIEHAEALLFGAQRLLLQMTGWLCSRQLAVTRISVQLEHERGRAAIAPSVIELMLAEPAWRDEHLVRLLKERLAAFSLCAPVLALVLEAAQVEPMLPPSESLFPEPGGTPADYHRLLELLVARLGADNVLHAAPLADYRPEMANAWVSVLQKVKTTGVAAIAPGLPVGVMPALPRPSWLLAKPVALLMREHRPFYGSPLRMASPPERIEAGWWQGELVTRDYFVAQGQDHAHYWIYRERIGGASGAEPRWYLHGLFG